jgi:hypothetical protein
MSDAGGKTARITHLPTVNQQGQEYT